MHSEAELLNTKHYVKVLKEQIKKGTPQAFKSSVVPFAQIERFERKKKIYQTSSGKQSYIQSCIQ